MEPSASSLPQEVKSISKTEVPRNEGKEGPVGVMTFAQVWLESVEYILLSYIEVHSHNTEYLS